MSKEPLQDTKGKVYDLKLFIMLFSRGRRNTYHHTTLIKIDGANDCDASKFYLGKKVAYVYKAPTVEGGSKI